MIVKDDEDGGEMRRLGMFLALVAAGVALVAAPTQAAPPPPQPPVAPPNGLLLGVSPYQGSGTQALDGSITAAGTFFNFPYLGAGDYQYELGAPEPHPVPGGKLRSGTFGLNSSTGFISGSLLCNVGLHSCLWQVGTATGGAEAMNQFFSVGHMKFVGRGGPFTDSGFFHNYSLKAREA
jgi:hypothetical protein